MQDWEQVRCFLAVMRERSLSGAAARLDVDISTVSRRLDRLEASLGAPLFDRTREGTTPTLLGEQLLPHAEEMELAAIRFGTAGARVETAVEGLVRITAPPGVAEGFVAPLLTELHAKHPKLVVELDASVGYADLTRREADIAIRATRPTSGDLVAVKLATARSLPLASPAYARELGKLRRFDDARWIAWGADLAQIPDAAWLRRHAPAVVPVLRTSHFGSQIAAAREGLGVMVTAHPPARTGLVPITPAKTLAAAWDDLPTGSIWLVGHRALRHVPRIEAVWQLALDAFSDRAR